MFPFNALGFVSLQRGGLTRPILSFTYHFFYRFLKEKSDLAEIEEIIDEFPIGSDGKRVIFIHNPKCAGKSVSSVLRPNKLISHIPAWKYENYFRQSGLNRQDFVLIAVVRDPIKRFLSAYKFYKVGGFTKDNMDVFDREGNQASHILSQFISTKMSRFKAPDDLVFLPQSYFICDDQNKLAVDLVFQESTLNADFSAFYKDKFGSKVDLPTKNVSSSKGSYSLELSEPDLNDLRKLYETDFRLVSEGLIKASE